MVAKIQVGRFLIVVGAYRYYEGELSIVKQVNALFDVFVFGVLFGNWRRWFQEK